MSVQSAAVEVAAAIQRIRHHTQEAWTEGVSLVTSSKSPDKPTLKFGNFAPFSENMGAELASLSSPVLLQACAGRIALFALDSLKALPFCDHKDSEIWTHHMQDSPSIV